MEVTSDTNRGRVTLNFAAKVQDEDLFRESLLQVLAFAVESHIKQWVLDFTASGCLHESEERWLQVDFFPRLMMALGTGNYVAYVLPEACYNKLLNEVGTSGMHTYNSFVIMNTFCTAASAEAWLDGEQFSQAS
ncbi:hypothetical protein [Pontibacter sp. CAU 1760]